MGNTCDTRARNEGLTQRLDSFRLVGLEQPKRHVLRMCFARGQDYLDTADGKRDSASGCALQEVAALYCVHGFLPKPTPRRGPAIVHFVAPNCSSPSNPTLAESSM